ncbi:MAG: hypothetical protein E6G70_21205 [Alphaproteobacteria bacterium]|nr:MAG: hypothetical protein E6G70_21205 [Alphaproteobacteria bacterium]
MQHEVVRRRTGTQSSFVMAGLVPAIYVFGRPRGKDADARVKPAHDGGALPLPLAGEGRGGGSLRRTRS